MSKTFSRSELIESLQLLGGSGGVCDQAAQMLAADNSGQRLRPGDYFTHDRTGIRFVCVSVTDRGMGSYARAEVELADPPSTGPLAMMTRERT